MRNPSVEILERFCPRCWDTEWALVRLTPSSMCPHPSPCRSMLPAYHGSIFPLKHQTVISLNTIWRLLASAPSFFQTLINVTGVYSFFLLFHFLQNISALQPADIHLLFGELSSAGEGGRLRLGFKQLTVIKSRQRARASCKGPSWSPLPASLGRGDGREILGEGIWCNLV